MGDRERVELLPCPFCGSNDVHPAHDYPDDALCRGCRTSAPINVWNRRHESDELRTLRALAERVERAPVRTAKEARCYCVVFAPNEMLGKRVALVALEDEPRTALGVG